jgi:hypothetical protein
LFLLCKGMHDAWQAVTLNPGNLSQVSAVLLVAMWSPLLLSAVKVRLSNVVDPRMPAYLPGRPMTPRTNTLANKHELADITQVLKYKGNFLRRSHSYLECELLQLLRLCGHCRLQPGIAGPQL